MKEPSHFRVEDMLPIGMTLVVLGIAIAYGLQVMGDVRDGMSCASVGTGLTSAFNKSTHQCYVVNATGSKVCSGCGNGVANSAEINATVSAITGVAKIPAKLPTIVTVIVAAVIIGILVNYLWFRHR